MTANSRDRTPYLLQWVYLAKSWLGDFYSQAQWQQRGAGGTGEESQPSVETQKHKTEEKKKEKKKTLQWRTVIVRTTLAKEKHLLRWCAILK